MKLNHYPEVSNKLPTPKNFRTINNWFFQGIVLFIVFILFGFFFSALANIVWKGLAGLAQSIASQEIQFAIRLSLFTSITSTLICIFFALPVAYGLERFKIWT